MIGKYYGKEWRFTQGVIYDWKVFIAQVLDWNMA